MIRLVLIAWIIGISGIGLTQAWLVQYSSLWWGVATCGGMCLYLILWLMHFIQKHIWLNYALKLLTALSMSMTAWTYADIQLKQYLHDEVKQQQSIEGIVYIKQLSEGKLDRQRQVAELLIPSQQKSLKILLYPKRIYDQQGEMIGVTTEAFEIGQFYQVTVNLRPPQGHVNIGSFDQERWLLQAGIRGTATVLHSKKLTPQEIQQRGWFAFVQQQSAWLPRWQLWVEKLRLQYRQALTKQPSQNDALLLGLLTGDRIAIDRETTHLYQIMGISHLLAISGPHVLLLAMALTWLCMKILHGMMRYGYFTRLYLFVPKQWLYLPIFLATVSFYVAFTGFEIPALRTWLMVSICSVALLFNIKMNKFTLLLLAASCILFWDCFAILSSAFWLSFGASAILLLIYQASSTQKESFLAEIGQFLQQLWQSQWRIFLALLPIVLWQFKAVSLLSPVINLFAIPFLSVIIVPLDILAALVWLLIPWLGELIWSCAGLLLALFNWLLKGLAPLAEWLYWRSLLTQISLLSLTVALFILALPKGILPRYWAIWFLLPIVLQKTARPLLQFDVLDIGQGQAIAVQTTHHQMMMDTAKGAWSAEATTMAEREIIPFLRGQGIGRLDEILLSHLDDDHSGGTADLVKEFDVRQIRSNTQDEKITDYPKIPFVTCYAGQTWTWDQVKFEILFPDQQDSRADQNESSCVVLITAPMQNSEFKILVMGDLGWEGEYKLMQRYPDLTADILVLGHHGSKYSSAYDFLQFIQPKLAIISVGADNRYGHPTAEVLARLQDLGIQYVDTIYSGQIHIELAYEQGLWTLQQARQRRQWLLPE